MAETDFKYDVFISYSHKDEEWVVNTLLPALENAGLSVCIDYRNFDAGRPSIVNMEDAVDESRHTVLVLTPNWTGSEWTDFEAILTQTDDPAGRRQKLIPIMLEKCSPPKRVKSLTYVDFMRSDRLDNAWAQLFKALGKPNAPIPTSATLKPATGSRDTWHLAHPYPMPPNFTGRATEQKMLDDWLTNDKDRLFILRALGGFGKSALSWQWINTHVNPTEWTKLVWWSFYEGDASFEHFIEETLKYLKLEVPQGQRPQVDELLKAMQGQKILLIMDGFERALRAYSSMNAAYQGDEEPKLEDNQLDCVNINAEIFLKSICSLPNIKSKVLMTTRLTPHAIKPRGEFMLGCCEEELTAMQPVDAVEFFHKQKIKGTHTEIEAACAPYGYHPLSLRLLAGRILKDFENPADIVVAQKLKIDGDIIQQKHHVLEVSYNSLSQREQKLLSTIACFRSPIEIKTLEAIEEDNKSLQDDLHDLVARGLLHFDEKNKKFDLHPIVRRYTYERLVTPDRIAAHTRLRDYFAAMDTPAKPQVFDDLMPVIELYHHTVRAEEFEQAYQLLKSRLVPYQLHYQFGAYQLIIELDWALFPDGENKPPRLLNESAYAWLCNSLASSYSLIGQPDRAVQLFESANNNVYAQKSEFKLHYAIVLGNLARQQIVMGALRNAESNLKHQVILCEEGKRDVNHQFYEGVGHQYLGRKSIYQGLWDSAEKEFSRAYSLFEDIKQEHAHTEVWIDRANSQYQFFRENQNPELLRKLQNDIDEALIVLEKTKDSQAYSLNMGYSHIYCLLGTVYHLNRQLDIAEHYLDKAIAHCRAINFVEYEANILLKLAHLRYDQKNYEEAKSLVDEALLITERCGYVLQGADVNLFLAQYALEQEKDKVKAKEYAEEARKLATCDGPPYYYKVAYEEAERFLDNL